MADIVFRPYLGIAQSPLSENAYSLCIDNDTVVGGARINRATINVPKESGESETLVDPVRFLNNYCLDGDGNFWQYTSTAGGQWELVDAGSGSGNDFVIWQDYAIVCRETNIDAIKLSDGTVTSGWQSDSGTVMTIGQDDVIYIGQGRFIRSIQRGTGSFDPATGSTYVYTSEALDLPDGESVTALAELGSYLAIGTRSGRVYLWDRVSTSFELPAQLPRKVEMLIPTNNILFVVLDNGDLHQTNGSVSSLVRKFPFYILNTEDNPSFTFNPNAWRTDGSKIYVGFGSTTSVSPMGVYSYDYSEGDFKIEHVISTGEIGDTNAVQITAMSVYDISYPFWWIGWKDGSTYGIDRVGIAEEDRYTDYTATAYSPFYKVGLKRNKRTIKHWEVTLADPLGDNEGVKIAYRTNLKGAWTDIGTFNTANKLSEVFDKAVTTEYIQIRVQLTTNDDVTPTLLEVRAD